MSPSECEGMNMSSTPSASVDDITTYLLQQATTTHPHLLFLLIVCGSRYTPPHATSISPFCVRARLRLFVCVPHLFPLLICMMLVSCLLPPLLLSLSLSLSLEGGPSPVVCSPPRTPFSLASLYLPWKCVLAV